MPAPVDSTLRAIVDTAHVQALTGEHGTLALEWTVIAWIVIAAAVIGAWLLYSTD